VKDSTGFRRDFAPSTPDCRENSRNSVGKKKGLQRSPFDTQPFGTYQSTIEISALCVVEPA